jgi:hypothetical protein
LGAQEPTTDVEGTETHLEVPIVDDLSYCSENGVK